MQRLDLTLTESGYLFEPDHAVRGKRPSRGGTDVWQRYARLGSRSIMDRPGMTLVVQDGSTTR